MLESLLIVDPLSPLPSKECCLCLLRGGALKPTDTGRWAHLVCAVSIPEVIIGDPHKKEPVEMEGLPRTRRKLVRKGSVKSGSLLVWWEGIRVPASDSIMKNQWNHISRNYKIDPIRVGRLSM